MMNKDTKKEMVRPGTWKKTLAIGKTMLLEEWSFEKGTKRGLHKHAEDHINYYAKGSQDLIIGGQKRIVREGDALLVPANVEHSYVTLEETIILAFYCGLFQK